MPPLLVQRVETLEDAFRALCSGVDILVGPPSAIAGLPGVGVLATLPDGSGRAVMGDDSRIRGRLSALGLTVEAWAIKYLELTTTENINEVSNDRPGGDQQSEEARPKLLYRHVMGPHPDGTALHAIPAGDTSTMTW